MGKPLLGPEFPWTRKQRTALLILLTLFTTYLAITYIRNRAFIDDPQPEIGARAGELADRFDPNGASWQELAAIPNLGEKKAKAIVDFREHWLLLHPGDPAFRGPQDLRQIKGIGPATVSNMTPYLIFQGSVKGTEKPEFRQNGGD